MTRPVAITLAVRLARIVFGLATSILTARFLGPSGRGDYTLAVTVAALVVQFGNLGLQSSNTYLVAKDRRLYAGLVSNSIGATALSIPLSGMVVLLEVHSDAHAGQWIWWAAALAPAALFILLGTNLLVGVGRIGLFNIFEFGYAALAVPLIAVAGALRGGVGGILFASAVTAWVIAIALLISLLNGTVRFRFDLNVLRAGVRFAMKAYLVALLGFLLLRVNVFLLERLVGPAELGQYSIAAQVADVLAVLPSSVALVLFPRLVADQATRWQMLLKSARTTAALILVICLATAVAAPPFIEVAFGHAFGPAVPMLLFMLPGIILLAVTTILSQYLAARGLPLTLAGAWVVALIAGISSSSALIPSHGGVGAAIGLSLAYGVLFVLVLVLTIIERNREIVPASVRERPA